MRSSAAVRRIVVLVGVALLATGCLRFRGDLAVSADERVWTPPGGRPDDWIWARPDQDGPVGLGTPPPWPDSPHTPPPRPGPPDRPEPGR